MLRSIFHSILNNETVVIFLVKIFEKINKQLTQRQFKIVKMAKRNLNEKKISHIVKHTKIRN